MLKKLALCAALVGALGHATTGFAAETVRMIVPFSAGGPTDLIARIIAPSLGEKLGKTVVVENKGGAGGTIGAHLVAEAPPDGNTILLSTSSLILSTGTRSNLPYDPRTALKAVYLLGEVQTMVAVSPKLGVNTLDELINKAKSTPNGLNYGSTGVGGTMHVGAELLRKAADIPLTHVPYRGAAPALVALIAGDVDLVNADVPVLQPYIKEGRIKGLVIYDTTRSALLPDVPTAKEAGMPALQMTNWYGILVPSKTPDAARNALESALAKVVREPDIAEKLAKAGFTNPQGAQAFQARLDQDFAQSLPWLKEANIHTD